MNFQLRVGGRIFGGFFFPPWIKNPPKISFQLGEKRWDFGVRGRQEPPNPPQHSWEREKRNSCFIFEGISRLLGAALCLGWLWVRDWDFLGAFLAV